MRPPPRLTQLGLIGWACMMSSPAAADTSSSSLYDRLWPELPHGAQLTMSEQLTDRLTVLGNAIGHHVDVLSYELVALNFDGRRRRARVRLGTTATERYLSFRLAGDVHFTQGMARIRARLDIGIAGRVLQLELPDVEMLPTSVRGERGVEIRLPVFRRSF